MLTIIYREVEVNRGGYLLCYETNIHHFHRPVLIYTIIRGVAWDFDDVRTRINLLLSAVGAYNQGGLGACSPIKF